MINFLEKNNILYKNGKATFPYKYDAYLGCGESQLVILPQNKEELKLILSKLKFDSKKYLIRGNGTNYSGAVQAQKYETIVSTEKINGKIKKINDYTYLVDPNMTLDEINKNLLIKKEGLIYPPDPASKSICTLGGSIAMNAGGAKCYKHGVTLNYTKELNIISPSIKEEYTLGSNQQYVLANYPIKQLFIGSEGTLGTIVNSTIKTIKKPKYNKGLILEFNDFKAAIKFIYNLLEKEITLSALDMTTYPYIPGESKMPKALLIINIEENKKREEEKKVKKLKEVMQEFCGKIKTEGELHLIRNNIVKDFIKIIMEKTNKNTYFLFDTVVPRNQLVDILEYFYLLAKKLNMPILNTYHAGDGNIHPTIYYDKELLEDNEKLKLFLYLMIKKSISLGGAISGEHGIGIEKKELQYLFTTPENYKEFVKIKNYFDKENILSKGKLLATAEEARKYKKHIEKLLEKYNIQDNIEINMLDNMENNPVIDGMVNVNLNEKQNKTNKNLKKVKIPYYPLINTTLTWKEHFELGIPSFLDNIVNLENIIMKLEDKFSKIYGKATLKNVEGYNLISYYLNMKEIKKATIKVMPSKEIENNINIYQIDSKVHEINEILSEKKDVIDYFYDNTLNKLFYLTQTEEEGIKKFDYLNGKNFGEFANFYIISLKNNIEIMNIKQKNWIYLKNENTLILKEKKLENKEWFIKNSNSIRKISDGKNTYVYLNDKYKNQLDILKEIQGGKNE